VEASSQEAELCSSTSVLAWVLAAVCCVAPGPRGGAHEVVCLAGSPISRGISSMVLVPSLAGGDPAPSHSKGSEEALLDFVRS
jgi:hypothetical protein